MTLKNYSKLDELEQHEAIWADGVQIGEKKEGDHIVVLYKLFGFYVELYHHLEYDVLRKLLTYCDASILDDYTPQKDNTLITR